MDLGGTPLSSLPELPSQGKLCLPHFHGGALVQALRWTTGAWRSPRACVPTPVRPCTHISVMASGRLAGMAVRPLPRQSTMPLLQVHMAGQEPEERVQEGTRPASPWPAETAGCDLRCPMPASPSRDAHGVSLAQAEPGSPRALMKLCGCLAHSRYLLDIC